VVTRARATIEKACRRVANCIMRAPARIRHHLDQAILSSIQESIIDLEVIESIFNSATLSFEECPEVEPSRAALKALCEIETAHFHALSIDLRIKVERSIAELVAAESYREHPVRAAAVFEAIATALGCATTPKTNSRSRTLITRYVIELEAIWRRAGLKPSRAIAYLNDAYRSRFHHFAELVLNEMAAPRASQHELRSLPDELEPLKAMQRTDYRWLVSDDHVRRALLRRFKFQS
jgi:hypothetical protein